MIVHIYKMCKVGIQAYQNFAALDLPLCIFSNQS